MDDRTEKLEKVKLRIKKLLAIAADNKTHDGEVEAAMKLAEEAMEKYHLEICDIEAAEEETHSHKETYAKVPSPGQWKSLSVWEVRLYNAIRDLVGSVDAIYGEHAEQIGVFKINKGKAIIWYGTAEDAQLAAELFMEWDHTLSTLAIGMYGNAYQGDGARYCCGFADVLFQRAQKEKQRRRSVITPSTTAIVKVGDGSLAQVLEGRLARAKKHFHVRYGKAGRARGYSYNGNADAYHQGCRDGMSAEFTAERKRKLTDGG